MGKKSKSFSIDPRAEYVVGEGFRLDRVDPGSHAGLSTKAAEKYTKRRAEELAELQERLYADSIVGGNRRILIVIQGMDTAGKSGVMRHVGGVIDPQGVRIRAFKKPTPEELEHDFLWRIERQVPRAGLIGFFDRSHYEDVLIGRVRELAGSEEIERRYGAIADFEQRLVDDGVRLIKVMLHISPDEQANRLAGRLERPDKYWKYNPGDLDERELWHDYMEAYQIALERTSTDVAPWFVVPADSKDYARAVVMRLLLDELRGMNLQWPGADFDPEAELRRLREISL